MFQKSLVFASKVAFFNVSRKKLASLMMIFEGSSNTVHDGSKGLVYRKTYVPDSHMNHCHRVLSS